MKQTISKNLIRLRGKLRQKEVAGAIGVKLTRYKGWEYGRSEPSATMLLKLEKFYNLKSVDDLIKEPVI